MSLLQSGIRPPPLAGIPSVSVFLLGDCRIRTGCAVLTPTAPTLFTLALYLIIKRGQRIPRQTLRTLLWPNVDGRPARQSLRSAIHKLRMNGLPIQGHGSNDPYLYIDRSAVLCDIDRIETEPIEYIVSQSYEPLPTFVPVGGAVMMDWVDDLRCSMVARMTQVLHKHLGAAREQGQWRFVSLLAAHLSQLERDDLDDDDTV